MRQQNSANRNIIISPYDFLWFFVFFGGLLLSGISDRLCCQIMSFHTECLATIILNYCLFIYFEERPIVKNV